MTYGLLSIASPILSVIVVPVAKPHPLARRNVQPNYKCSINSHLSNLFVENCKLYDDRRNVERKLETHFHISNLSSDIPAGVIGTQFIRKQMQ